MPKLNFAKSLRAKTGKKSKLSRKTSATQAGNGQTFLRPKTRGRLQRIMAWESLAVQACYSGTTLAQTCGVSLRQLQRHIRADHLKTLGEWLNALRLQHGYERLAQGCSVKETAFSLGFKQVSHFSRKFKEHYGFSPSHVPIATGVKTDPDGPRNAQIQLSLFERAES